MDLYGVVVLTEALRKDYDVRHIPFLSERGNFLIVPVFLVDAFCCCVSIHQHSLYFTLLCSLLNILGGWLLFTSSQRRDK